MPSDCMVADVLDDVFPLWDELYNHVTETYPNISTEWRHYGKASGWLEPCFMKEV